MNAGGITNDAERARTERWAQRFEADARALYDECPDLPRPSLDLLYRAQLGMAATLRLQIAEYDARRRPCRS